MVEFECENITYMPSPQPLNVVIRKKKKSGKIKKLEGPRNNEKKKFLSTHDRNCFLSVSALGKDQEISH